jgi:putative lipoic acid-binding regulatory protein
MSGAADDEEGRALALLEANHRFPTDYSVSVIALNVEEIAVRIATAASEDAGEAAPVHERRSSSGGKYVSHRLTVRVETARHVLALYARLRAIDGIKTIL